MAWVKKGEEAMFEAQAHPTKVNVYGAIRSREKICSVIMAGNMNSEFRGIYIPYLF